MKELIYRRNATGYAIDRCAEGISASSRAKGPLNAKKGLSDADRETFCYSQFRLEDGTIAISAGYADPYSANNRNSLMCHLLYVDASEIGQLMNGYPSDSDYFLRFREAFIKDQKHHAGAGETEIPVEAYLNRADGLQDAAQLLRERFRDVDTLAAVFEALLDAASNNPRMIVLFGPDEPLEQMAWTGRRIIEAMLAPLPTVLGRHLGYMSPGLTDADNALFGVRYSRPRPIDRTLRNHAYVVDLTNNKIECPNGADHAAAAYASELATLIFKGDAASLNRVRQMNRLLNDEGLYHVQNVPAKLALRYRYYSAPGKVSAEDREALLDWHHQIVMEAEKDPAALLHSKFWIVVDKWIEGFALPSLHENPGIWQKPEQRVDELYRDGQRLFLLGSDRADCYYQLFSQRLGVKPMLTEAREDVVSQQLIDCMMKELRRAKDNRFAERNLYWDLIERWLCRQWRAGRFFQNNAACEVVRRLYDLDQKRGENYVDIFAKYCCDNARPLLPISKSRFGRAVIACIIAHRPDFVAESMQKELGNKNLFALPGNSVDSTQKIEAPVLDDGMMNDFVSYRALVAKQEKLLARFEEIVENRFAESLRRAHQGDVARLIAEIRAAEQENHIISVCGRLIPRVNAREEIEKRLVALLSNEGIYNYYPKYPELAREVAELLDRRCGTNWVGRLKSLRRAHELKLTELNDDTFNSLMERGFGDGDSSVNSHVRRLLWQNIVESFSGKHRDNRRLLMALALCDCGGGFSPANIMRCFKELELSPKEALTICKKLKSADAMRGVEYVARLVYAYGADETDVDWAEYPGRASLQKRTGAMFGGIPMPVPVLVAVLSCAGLVSSVLGVLINIGLI